MLCPACRVHLRRDFPYCLKCGTPRRKIKLDTFVAPLLVPVAATDRPVPEPIALAAPAMTVGRAPDNDIVIDHPSVSRYHARIVRAGSSFVVEDLDSLNGVRIGSRSLNGRSEQLFDGATVEFGDVELRFDQPRGAEVGGRTVYGASQTMLPTAATAAEPAEATDSLSITPRRRSGWALKRVPGAREGYALSTRAGGYLHLDERDAFIFEHIDGRTSLRDLLLLYAQKYGELALPRIERVLRTLAAHGLIEGIPSYAPTQRTGLRRVGHAIYQALLRLEISIGRLDTLMGRLYQALGWRFFTRTGTFAVWAVIGAGLYAFLVARGKQRLFDIGGAGWWGALVVGLGYLFALLVHEASHALAVKSYGRKVRRGGFMIMMGMPFAFVDTSDMWFGTRWSRVVVSMSGPMSTAVLAGVAAMGAAWAPGAIAPALCFQLAFGLYMNTAYNFNPIMPLDGYQALTDAFRIPHLREEATRYLLRGLWADVKARRTPRLRQLGLALYGLAVVVGTYLFLLLGLVAWRDRLGPLLHRHVPSPWDTVVLVAGIGLVTFPVWVRIGSRLKLLARRVPRRPRAEAQAVVTEAAA